MDFRIPQTSLRSISAFSLTVNDLLNLCKPFPQHRKNYFEEKENDVDLQCSPSDSRVPRTGHRSMPAYYYGLVLWVAMRGKVWGEHFF